MLFSVDSFHTKWGLHIFKLPPCFLTLGKIGLSYPDPCPFESQTAAFFSASSTFLSECNVTPDLVSHLFSSSDTETRKLSQYTHSSANKCAQRRDWASHLTVYTRCSEVKNAHGQEWLANTEWTTWFSVWFCFVCFLKVVCLF